MVQASSMSSAPSKPGISPIACTRSTFPRCCFQAATTKPLPPSQHSWLRMDHFREQLTYASRGRDGPVFTGVEQVFNSCGGSRLVVLCQTLRSHLACHSSLRSE